MNPLGLPESPEQWWAVAHQLRARTTRSVASLRSQAAHEERLAGFIRRDGSDAIRRPSDILPVRSAATRLDLTDAQATGLVLDQTGSLAALALDAMPHWLPGSTALGVAESEPAPPDAIRRLPYDAVAVWFAHPAEIGDLSTVVPDSIRADFGATTPSPWPWPWEHSGGCYMLVDSGILNQAAEPDLTVDGVILLADGGGHPVDLAAWVLTETVPGAPGAVRMVVPCIPSQAELRWLLDNMLGVVVWAQWRLLQSRRPLQSTDRRSVRQWLRREDPDHLIPVRVLDTGRREPRGSAEGDGTRRESPRTHLRRGHFRRQWMPSAGEHEIRWIPPVVVAPWSVDDERVTVWRIH